MNDIKKIYIKLNTLNTSLLSQATNQSAIITDGSWDDFNALLEQLTRLTQDEHYSSLKLAPGGAGAGRQSVLVSIFSSKVYQAVNYLFETNRTNEVLDDQHPPEQPKSDNGAGVSQTSILSQAQNNEQSQVTEVNVEFNQTLTYLTEAIIEAKASYPEGTKERRFLDSLKEGISTAKNTAELIKMIMSFAIQLGITTEVLGEIFKNS